VTGNARKGQDLVDLPNRYRFSAHARAALRSRSDFSSPYRARYLVCGAARYRSGRLRGVGVRCA
jgi:hypothetical protein